MSNIPDTIYYVIHNGEITIETCHRNDVASIDHFLPHGEVIARWTKLSGVPDFEYRQLRRCSARAPSGACIGNPASWSLPIHVDDLPPLLKLYLTLTQ